MITRLSCSQCSTGSYVRTAEGPNDYKCEHCPNELMYSDIADHLDEGEHIAYDDDGYVGYKRLGCWNCGSTAPVQLGGHDDAGNQITTCGSCGERQEEE